MKWILGVVAALLCAVFALLWLALDGTPPDSDIPR